MANQSLIDTFKQRIQNELTQAKKAIEQRASQKEKAEFYQVYWRLRFVLGFVPPNIEYQEIEIVEDEPCRKLNLPVIEVENREA